MAFWTRFRSSTVSMESDTPSSSKNTLSTTSRWSIWGLRVLVFCVNVQSVTKFTITGERAQGNSPLNSDSYRLSMVGNLRESTRVGDDFSADVESRGSQAFTA